MNFFRKLIPGFLKAWDLRLLQRHPRFWSTRLHYHLWFLLLTNVMVFLLGMILRVNERTSPDPEEMFGYMILPAVIYLACWIYRVVRFNLEKRNGIRKPYAEVGEFLVHWISLLLIASIPYTLALTVALRTAHLVSDDDFRQEVSTLNTQARWFYGTTTNPDNNLYDPELLYDVTAYDYETDVYEDNRGRQPQGSGTHRFFRDLNEYIRRNDPDERANLTIERGSLHEIYASYIHKANVARDSNTDSYDLDTAAYYNAKGDSIEKNFQLLFMRHGMYTPPYLVMPFEYDSLLEVTYVNDIRSQRPLEPEEVRISALTIAHKYDATVREIGPDNVLAEFKARQRSTTGIYGCRPRMNEISRAKGLHYFFTDEDFMRYFLTVASLVLALLVSAFKNIYWQPFLILFVTAAILPVVIVIFSLLTEHGVFDLNDDTIMIYCWWCVGLFTLIMLFFIRSLKAYRTNRAVMLMMANLGVPFFALFTLMILHDRFDVFGMDALNDVISTIRSADSLDPRLPGLELQANVLREKIDLFVQVFFWGGLVLYTFALHPIFRSLYVRLMALPERK